MPVLLRHVPISDLRFAIYELIANPLDKILPRRQTVLMKLSVLLALGAVWALLIVASFPVSAEETHMSALQTALSSTTVSGSVDTSTGGTSGSKDAAYHGNGWWWQSFRLWLRAHGWR